MDQQKQRIEAYAWLGGIAAGFCLGFSVATLICVLANR